MKIKAITSAFSEVYAWTDRLPHASKSGIILPVFSIDSPVKWAIAWQKGLFWHKGKLILGAKLRVFFALCCFKDVKFDTWGRKYWKVCSLWSLMPYSKLEGGVVETSVKLRNSLALVSHHKAVFLASTTLTRISKSVPLGNRRHFSQDNTVCMSGLVLVPICKIWKHGHLPRCRRGAQNLF